MAKGGGSSWLKYGCIGCAGIVLVIILISAAISMVAWRSASSEEVERKDITRELPPPPAVAQPEEMPVDAPAGEAPIAAPVSGAAGRVSLDFSGGGFAIRPAKPGDPLHLDAVYDKTRYELVEEFQENSDGTWSYDVTFRRKGSFMMAILAQVFGGTSPEVKVYLPRDVPMDLQIRTAEGGTEVELGSLWLTNADIAFARGGAALEIDEPLKAPMHSMTISGRMGGVAFQNLGNASPAKLDVDVSMGGAALILDGQWMNDSDISLRWSRGGMAVILPDNVAVSGLSEKGIPDDSGGEVSPPTLRFTLDGKLKDLEVERR